MNRPTESIFVSMRGKILSLFPYWQMQMQMHYVDPFTCTVQILNEKNQTFGPVVTFKNFKEREKLLRLKDNCA